MCTQILSNKIHVRKIMSHHLVSLLRKDQFYVYYTWNLLKHNMQVTGLFYFFPRNQVPWVDISTLLDTEWLALSRIWHFNRSSLVKSWNTKQAPFFFSLQENQRKDEWWNKMYLLIYGDQILSWNLMRFPVLSCYSERKLHRFVLKGDNNGQKDNIVHERTLVVYTWYTYHKTHRIHAWIVCE